VELLVIVAGLAAYLLIRSLVLIVIRTRRISKTRPG
jgi:hypothetical protein